MGNKVMGQFDLPAGDKTYKIEFTPNGWCELEDVVGCGTMEFLKRLEEAEEKLNFRDVRLLMWAGLIEHHDGITLKDAGRVIKDAGGLEVVFQKLGEAVKASMPQGKDSGGDGGSGNAEGTS
ncbi:GTA-gp10 family protein [uncultured Pelagimonas sp.]|uniref:GTA-gp10 family protein n=1 Tax=uncultured Pelagimonas sp. TaxID=1618102 RepID=UPI002631CE2D|nr:GTA-gp10 family protein [uncultured Pelagimonas sp.]